MTFGVSPGLGHSTRQSPEKRGHARGPRQGRPAVVIHLSLFHGGNMLSPQRPRDEALKSSLDLDAAVFDGDRELRAALLSD
jgi:hypothetical protein